MKRRTFVVLTSLAIVTIPTTGKLVVGGAEKISYDYISGIIAKKLSYLRYDSDMVTKFICDYSRSCSGVGSMDVHRLSSLASVKILLKLLPSTRALINDLEEKIARDFLLSTDFFQNGSDVSKPLKYLGLYEPRLRPCTNPFLVV